MDTQSAGASNPIGKKRSAKNVKNEKTLTARAEAEARNTMSRAGGGSIGYRGIRRRRRFAPSRTAPETTLAAKDTATGRPR